MPPVQSTGSTLGASPVTLRRGDGGVGIGRAVHSEPSAMFTALLRELKQVNAELNDLEALAGVADVRGVPGHLEVDFSSRCNYRCPMCHQSKMDMGRVQLDRLAIDSLIDSLPCVDTVMIAGLGEPLLYPGLGRFLPYLRRYGCRSHLFTNGELIHRHLQLLRSIDRISISLDGATAETFEYLRQGGNFGRVVDNIRALRTAAPGTRLVTSTVISRRNVGEVAAIVALAAELGIAEVHLSPVDHTPVLALHAEDEGQFFDQLRQASVIADQAGLQIFNNLKSAHFLPGRNASISSADRGLQPIPELWPDPEGMEQPPSSRHLHGMGPEAETAELRRRLDVHHQSLRALKQVLRAQQSPLALPYCSAPWKYGFARSRGDARLCPYADLDVGRVSDVLGGNYNSNLLTRLRESMAQGEPCLSVCRGCTDDHRHFRRDALQQRLDSLSR